MVTSSWEIANTLAQAVAAFGTLAAVIVSLWLARRQGAPRVKVRNGVMIQLGGAQPMRSEYFQVAATNTGHRDVVVNGIGWRVGRFRKRTFFVIPPNPPFPTVPKKLQPAEEVLFLFSLDNFLKGSDALLDAFGKDRLARWRARRARVGVWLSTGEEFYVRVDKTVLDELVKLLAAKQAATQAVEADGRQSSKRK